MAYQSNLLGDFWRGYRQRRIGSGMPLSQNEIGGLLGPMLANDARKAREQGLLDEQRRRFDLQREDQQMAGKVAGVGQLAQLPIAYGAAKSMGWLGGGAATAQGAVAPAAASTLGAQGLASAAYPGIAGGTAAPGAVGGMSAVGAGSPGLLATAAPFAAAGGAGLLGGALLGPTLDKILPGGGKTGKAVGGAAGGAIAGAAAGSIVPGVGTVVGGLIGGAIGAISSLF